MDFSNDSLGVLDELKYEINQSFLRLSFDLLKINIKYWTFQVFTASLLGA